jgi:DNA-binding protein HU-beta
MNKSELIDAISSEAKITKADAGRALDGFINSATKALKKGDRVALVGFGTFSISKRAARTGRNPQTGKAIQIKAKKVAKFKAGADLAKTVNK